MKEGDLVRLLPKTSVRDKLAEKYGYVWLIEPDDFPIRVASKLLRSISTGEVVSLPISWFEKIEEGENK